jgi:hypothetical protein
MIQLPWHLDYLGLIAVICGALRLGIHLIKHGSKDIWPAPRVVIFISVWMMLVLFCYILFTRYN